MIRFGILSFAHVHADGYARALQSIAGRDDFAKLVALCDDNAERLRSKSSAFGIKRTFDNYEDMFKSGEIDAVVIMSENNKHADQVASAAANGVHIICEKPVATGDEQLEKMRVAVRRAAHPIAFQTAFVCRYSPTVIDVKRQLDSGSFGAVRAISATNHGQFPGGWFGDAALSGGGAVIDHTVHAADLIRLFTGDEIGDVRAFRGSNIRAELAVEDVAMIYGRLQKSRIPVSIDCSWSRHSTWPTWGDLTMSIVCEKGVIKFDAFSPHISVANKSGMRWHGISEDLNEKLIRAFCNTILEMRGEPPVPGSSVSALARELRADFEDGARASEVAIKAYKSIQSGGEAIA